MNPRKNSSILVLGAAAAIMSAGPASAGVISINQTAFGAGAGLLTFSEFPLNTLDPYQNPVFDPASYGAGPGSPTVSFGGFFEGQSLGSAGNCPVGAVLTGCVVGAPSDALALDPNAPATAIVSDSAVPTSPVVSGSPTFNGPISILFDTDLAGVGLDGGYFDAIGGTAITAFDRSGNELGSVANEQTGIEFLGLVTEDNENSIAGVQFSLAGSEPAGFSIDNLRFGSGTQVTPPISVPEPGTVGLLGLGLLGMGVSRRRRE